ncbi:MAG: class I SAM-dependent methyltransferase, partial [Acidimicrobiales bacterium]
VPALFGQFPEPVLDHVGVATGASVLDVGCGTGVLAESLPFDDGSFDHAVSQFAAMFFTDRLSAVAEMARVTQIGGTVTVVTWASLDQTPGYQAMVALIADELGDQAADVRGWTLADLVDDAAEATLVARAERELARFVSSDGSVAFPSPAIVGTAVIDR